MPWVDVTADIEIRLARGCFRTYRAGQTRNVPRRVAAEICARGCGHLTVLNELGRPARGK